MADRPEVGATGSMERTRALFLVCCVLFPSVTAADALETPRPCNAATMRDLGLSAGRPGQDMDRMGVRITEPIARALHDRAAGLKPCHAMFGRIGVRAGTLNFQVRLNNAGQVDGLCVLEDTAWDAVTLNCVSDWLRGTVFPPGVMPMMFRWRLRLEVD